MGNQSWTPKKLAKHAYQICHEFNADFWPVFAGKVGSGKSAASRVFMREYCQLAGIPFDLNKITYYNADALMTDMEAQHKGAFIMDEAINIYSRKWMRKSQTDFNMFADMIRDHNHCCAFNVPNFMKLDSHLRERAECLVFIHKRFSTGKGKGWVMFKEEDQPFSTDLFNTKENWKLARSKKLYKSKNYYGELIIDDYSKFKWFQEMEVLADKIKDEKKLQVLDSADYSIRDYIVFLNGLSKHMTIPKDVLKAYLDDLHISLESFERIRRMNRTEGTGKNIIDEEEGQPGQPLINR